MDVLSVGQIAASVEAELERLRQRRPWLASRIDRAETILTTHLSCKRQRVIRVRIDAKGHACFLVNGSGGAVYVVDPQSWSCSCPDHHRRDAACKHSVAAWILSRAARATSTPRTRQCDGCGTRFPSAGLYDVPEGHEMFFEGERVCRSCAVAHAVL